MMTEYPRAVPCGDCAVTIEFGDRIDEAINARVLALDRNIGAAPPAGVVETVPTYRSLLVHYDPLATTYDAIAGACLTLAGGSGVTAPGGRTLEIPVCYEDEFGTDVADVAAALGISVADVIDLHAKPLYRVYMLGFQPGFAYLGGLDPRLSLPRRSSPRFGAKAGTISIAAGQCAVHSVDGPSGWHWIGRTPLATYTAGEAPRFLIEPGDRIRFRPVPPRRWHELAAAARSESGLVEEES